MQIVSRKTLRIINQQYQRETTILNNQALTHCHCLMAPEWSWWTGSGQSLSVQSGGKAKCTQGNLISRCLVTSKHSRNHKLHVNPIWHVLKILVLHKILHCFECLLGRGVNHVVALCGFSGVTWVVTILRVDKFYQCPHFLFHLD